MTAVNGKRRPNHSYRIGCMCDVCMDVRVEMKVASYLVKEEAERKARDAWRRL